MTADFSAGVGLGEVRKNGWNSSPEGDTAVPLSPRFILSSASTPPPSNAFDISRYRINCYQSRRTRGRVRTLCSTSFTCGGGGRLLVRKAKMPAAVRHFQRPSGSRINGSGYAREKKSLFRSDKRTRHRRRSVRGGGRYNVRVDFFLFFFFIMIIYFFFIRCTNTRVYIYICNTQV